MKNKPISRAWEKKSQKQEDLFSSGKGQILGRNWKGKKTTPGRKKESIIARR